MIRIITTLVLLSIVWFGRQANGGTLPSGNLDLYAGVKWGSQTLGTPARITYSFFGEQTYYRNEKRFATTPENVKTLFRNVLLDLSGIGGVTFVEVPDDGTPWNGFGSFGDMRLGMVKLNRGIRGEAYTPIINGPSGGGDVVISTDTPVDRLLRTILHETLHGMGFEHSLLNSDVLFRFDVPSVNAMSSRERAQFAAVYGPAFSYNMVSTEAVPEPSTIILIVSGIIPIVCAARRRRTN